MRRWSISIAEPQWLPYADWSMADGWSELRARQTVHCPSEEKC